MNIHVCLLFFVSWADGIPRETENHDKYVFFLRFMVLVCFKFNFFLIFHCILMAKHFCVSSRRDPEGDRKSVEK